MKQHLVYFFGSTRITFSGNRNQIIGFDGIDQNIKLVKYGNICLNAKNSNGLNHGETGTLYPQENITIVPFRYHWCTHDDESNIVKHLEDVIVANEMYIKSESIGIPLMMLKNATNKGYNLLGRGSELSDYKEKEIEFKNKWCCFGHFYLHLFKKALQHKGYSAINYSDKSKFRNLRNAAFLKKDGTKLIIHADAGL